MARDNFIVAVSITVPGPEWEMKSPADDWADHFHHNGEAKDAVRVMITQALNRTELAGMFELYPDIKIEIEMSPTEEKRLQEERDARDAAWNAEAEKIGSLGAKLGTTKSCWSAGDNDKLLDNATFHTGKCRLVYDPTEYWGDAVESDVMIHPTYQNMWMAAEKLIRLSGDSHHIFVEGFNMVGTQDGVQIFDLITGS